MYVGDLYEPLRCAECNRLLPETCVDDAHNRALDAYFLPTRVRTIQGYATPYFCSFDCTHNAIKLDRLKKKHLNEHGEMPANWRDILRDAYERYFAEYEDEYHIGMNKRHEKNLAFLARAEVEQQKQAQDDLQRARETPIPLEIPSDHLRFEHTHILGGAGAGKTTLIQEFILHDLQREDAPGIVVIDPKGLLTERIRRLELVDPSRLVVIDATDPHSPKLGLFSQGIEDEHSLTQAISTYGYIFESNKFKFTAKQAICFDYCVRLMFAMNGTLSTLMQLLRSRPQNNVFTQHFAALPDEVRNFFEHDFYASGSGGYDSTRAEINVRLQGIAQRPMLKAIFDTTERDVDLFQCIQDRKIVLVNTGLSRDPTASQMMGRFIIAMVLNATYVRSMLPQDQWPPTFLYIDEFQQFMDDSKTPEMLRLAREYNVGIIMAHHNMHAAELDDGLRSALSSNTSIKFCSSIGGMDLNYMARDLNCEGSFLRMQQKTATHARFALSVRGMHDEPVSIEVPLGNIDAYPKRAMPASSPKPRPLPARVAPVVAPAVIEQPTAIKADPQDFA